MPISQSHAGHAPRIASCNWLRDSQNGKKKKPQTGSLRVRFMCADPRDVLPGPLLGPQRCFVPSSQNKTNVVIGRVTKGGQGKGGRGER